MKKFFVAVAGVIAVIAFGLSRARYLARAFAGEEAGEE